VSPRAPAVAASLWLCVLGCKDASERKAPTPAPTPALAPTPVPAPADGAVWRTRVEAIPGHSVLTWVNGPRRFGNEIWVGSSAIGVAALEPETGKLLSQERESGPFLKRSADPDTLRTVRVGGAEVSVTRESMARTGAWRHTFAEPVALGVGGPLVVGETAAAVVDDALVGIRWQDGEQIWRSEGRFSHVAGSLRAGAGAVLLAVAHDGGVGPALVDPESGALIRGGDRAPGLHALAAAWLPGGELAVVVRRDSSLQHDALAVFDAGGHLAWQWPLPRPDQPRTDPVGLIGDGDGFVLFYDGRYCARFARPSGP